MMADHTRTRSLSILRILQGSWCFPEGLLVLSLYHSSPRPTGTVSRGLVIGAGTYSQHCHVGNVQKWVSALTGQCCLLGVGP